MENVLIGALLLVLALLGITEVIRMIAYWSSASEEESKMLIVVPLYGHTEEAEWILRSALRQFNWSEYEKCNEIICVDYGMDDETKEICRKICNKYDGIRILQPDEIDNVFRCKSINDIV